MARIEIPDELDEDEAKKALKRKARRKSKQSTSGGSKSNSSDDQNFDGLIILGAILLALGYGVDKVVDFVLSLI